MATSLYDLSVPTFLQTVKAVRGFLDRAIRHCSETRADPDDFVHARLFDDMAPFHFQIEAAWHHSVWGLEAVKTGVFASARRENRGCAVSRTHRLRRMRCATGVNWPSSWFQTITRLAPSWIPGFRTWPRTAS